MSVVATCTYTVCHLLNFYRFLSLINVTFIDLQGNFISCPSAPPPSSSASFTLSSPPPSLSLFLFFILYSSQPVFRSWLTLSSTSNLLCSLLLFSNFVSMAMIKTASSHIPLGFPMVIFPLKHSSITALGKWESSILTVTHYFVFHVICDLFSTCLIFEGVKSLICSLPHRLHCVWT